MRQPARVILMDGAYSAPPASADLVDVSVDERHARLLAREEHGF